MLNIQMHSSVANVKTKIGKCEICSDETRCLGQQATSAPLGVEENRNSASNTHCATGITFIYMRQYDSHMVRAFCSQHSLRSLKGDGISLGELLPNQCEMMTEIFMN